jgi:hypothetical protein
MIKVIFCLIIVFVFSVMSAVIPASAFSGMNFYRPVISGSLTNYQLDSQPKVAIQNLSSANYYPEMFFEAAEWTFVTHSVGFLFCYYIYDSQARDNMSYSNFESNLKSTSHLQDSPTIWYCDYVLHPYKDAQSYLLMRNQGASIISSYGFSLFQVFVWEYMYTGWCHTAVDRKDLMTGMVSGLVLGEAIHQATNKMAENGFSWPEKGLVILINPAYFFQSGWRFNR